MQSKFTTNELIKMACSVKRIDHHLGKYHLNLYSIHQIIDAVRNTVMDEKASLAFGKEAVAILNAVDCTKSMTMLWKQKWNPNTGREELFASANACVSLLSKLQIPELNEFVSHSAQSDDPYAAMLWLVNSLKPFRGHRFDSSLKRFASVAEALDWLRGHCDKQRKSQIMFCGQWLYSPQQMVLALCNARMPHEYIMSKIDQKQVQILGGKGHLVQILSVNISSYFMPMEWCLRLICEWRYCEASLAEFQARCMGLV